MSEMTPTEKPSGGDRDKPITEVEDTFIKKEKAEQEQEEQKEDPKKEEEVKEEKASEDAPAEDVAVASTENAAKGEDADTSEKADASVDKEDKSDASGEEEPPSNGDVSPGANVEGKVGGDTKLLKELDDEAPKTFPQVLMEILSDEEDSDTISWLPHGRSFIIYKKKKFAANVLPKFFKATKFTSFTRKLNRWGFTRVTRGPEMGSYYHKLFLRDDPSLCLRMSSHSSSKFQEQQQLMPAPMAPGGMPFGAMPFGMPGMPMPGMNPMMAGGMPGMNPADLSQQNQFINQQLQQLQWQQFQLQQLQQQQHGGQHPGTHPGGGPMGHPQQGHPQQGGGPPHHQSPHGGPPQMMANHQQGQPAGGGGNSTPKRTEGV